MWNKDQCVRITTATRKIAAKMIMALVKACMPSLSMLRLLAFVGMPNQPALAVAVGMGADSDLLVVHLAAR